jgi:ADP-heptose:LPS heptosyltransferase
MSSRFWIRTAPLPSTSFPRGTPLAHFFAWNESASRPDRRYVIAQDILALLRAFSDDVRVREICVAHLARRPTVRARIGGWLLLAREMPSRPSEADDGRRIAARDLVERLAAAIGSAEPAAHAAVFAAFEALAREVDLAALAALRPRLAAARHRLGRRRILVIRLSAFGDFIQSLGPMAAIRRQHPADHIALLTTAPFVDFATALGYFDAVLIDPRSRPSAFGEWWALRRQLRQGGFDRVYDLQTSQRSSSYRRLLGGRDRPEWSGIAHGCSHPHANLGRDSQHTIDRQAEQLLMAGIHPTPLPSLPPAARELPADLASRDFVLLVPGSSPHRPEKRWPAECYGRLALALDHAGHVPVVVGTDSERALGARIGEICPRASNLVGRTDLVQLAALAQHARLTVGNDTGVCHLAAAAGGGAAVVLFSAASDPALCAPRGRCVRLLTVPDLAELTVERVFAEAMTALRLAPQPAEAAPA